MAEKINFSEARQMARDFGDALDAVNAALARAVAMGLTVDIEVLWRRDIRGDTPVLSGSVEVDPDDLNIWGRDGVA